MKNRHPLFAICMVICFGVVLFYFGTDGFHAWTTEGARIYDLQQQNPTIPSVMLEDSQNRTYSYTDFAKGRYVFLTFMYTSCTTVCPQLELNMAEVYQQISPEFIGKKIAFLSISFDPAHDNPQTLAKYRSYFNSDGETWRMARIRDEHELNKLLKQLGVLVIPDGNGNFQHNTAFYLIGKNGRLLSVMDYEKVNQASERIMTILENDVEG